MAVILSLLVTTPGLSAVTQQTVYRPFIVHGKTAKAIYQAVIGHSTKKDGFSTYATTDVTLKPSLKAQMHPICKITSTNIAARFVIHLPSLPNVKNLPPSLRHDWLDFTAQLKRHEEHHREIWLGCAAELEEAIRGIPPGDCKDFVRQMNARATAAKKSCDRKNAAFDNEAQETLPAIPFIRRALAPN
jgi:predicted secreted Zn-dependent protease